MTQSLDYLYIVDSELLSHDTQILTSTQTALAIVAGGKNPKAANALYEALQHDTPIFEVE